MRIAVPLQDGVLSAHFGHCERFALLDVDEPTRQIAGREDVASPPHQPGLLPAWLAERGADVIIAAGMGRRAQALFAEQGIDVAVGAQTAPPEALAEQYLDGTLKLGQNICDH